jgi:hypothetical protein
MKTTRPLLFFIAASATIAHTARAQVEFYILEKRTNYLQTSAAAPSAADYRFTFEINGTNLSGLTNHSVTTPGGTGTATVAYDIPGDRWKYYQDYGSKAALDAAFFNGSYSVTVDTASNVPLTLEATPSADFYPSGVPQLISANNGALWSAGKLLVSDTGTTTLTLSSFSEYNSVANGQLAGHIGMSLLLTGPGSFTEVNQEAFTFNADPAFNTFMISGLTAGSTYQFELEYNILTALDSGSLAGATGAALFTNRLQIDIQAVPEPATYAMIIGGLSLAMVAVYRRHRLAAY